MDNNERGAGMSKNFKEIKSMAMLKMEKNFIAVMEKGYERKPYDFKNPAFWIVKITQELDELTQAWVKKDYQNIREELADISNVCDYLYEIILQREIEED